MTLAEAVIGPNHPDRRALLARDWDAIVIGTGIGGGTFGLAFARAGKKVLFCERGLSHLAYDDQVVSDDWAERLFRPGGPTSMPEHLRHGGRFVDRMIDQGVAAPEPFTPFLGAGTGGSSALYGMVMERFFPSDFTPARYFPDAPADANIVERWPIGMADLDEYYTVAERIYSVHATKDPLRPASEARGIEPPPAYSPTSAEIADRLAVKGAHPYHLPMACAYVPGCAECIGFICGRRCKKDSATACLEPALRDHGAFLLPDCDVQRLDSANGRVSSVEAIVSGAPIRLTGRVIALAAGAIHSPAILLRSGEGPRHGGIANRSGQVGQNLMRHHLDYYVVKPRARQPDDALLKQLAFNDLYVIDGTKFGTVQSNGRMAPVPALVAGLRDDWQSKSSLLAKAFPLIRPAATRVVTKMLEGAHVLASIQEDLPYRSNRIGISDDGKSITFHYRLNDYEHQRIATFRGAISRLLKPQRFHLLKAAERTRVLGHICGTCRAGDDPRTSVVDRDNRAHELDNLYIVDSSFFPSSSGTNPSLTIAANALRVAAGLGAPPAREEAR